MALKGSDNLHFQRKKQSCRYPIKPSTPHPYKGRYTIKRCSSRDTTERTARRPARHLRDVPNYIRTHNSITQNNIPSEPK